MMRGAPPPFLSLSLSLSACVAKSTTASAIIPSPPLISLFAQSEMFFFWATYRPTRGNQNTMRRSRTNQLGSVQNDDRLRLIRQSKKPHKHADPPVSKTNKHANATVTTPQKNQTNTHPKLSCHSATPRNTNKHASKPNQQTNKPNFDQRKGRINKKAITAQIPQDVPLPLGPD